MTPDKPAPYEYRRVAFEVSSCCDCPHNVMYRDGYSVCALAERAGLVDGADADDRRRDGGMPPSSPPAWCPIPETGLLVHTYRRRPGPPPPLKLDEPPKLYLPPGAWTCCVCGKYNAGRVLAVAVPINRLHCVTCPSPKEPVPERR